MVRIIKHKVNWLPSDAGPDRMIEIDVRDVNEKLCVEHDAFKRKPIVEGPSNRIIMSIDSTKPICLDTFVSMASRLGIRLIAINVKSDGLEKEIEKVMRYEKMDWFVFDMSRPSYHQFQKILDPKHLCLPVSEYDSVADLGHYNWAQWIWLDCFNGRFDKQFEQYKKIKKEYCVGKDFDTNIVFVAPDLHGCRENNRSLFTLINEKPDENLYVCTDYPEDFQ